MTYYLIILLTHCNTSSNVRLLGLAITIFQKTLLYYKNGKSDYYSRFAI